MERTYRTYRPESVTDTASVPLVVMLHGALGSGKQAEAAYNWNKEADKRGFIVAYPDGYRHTWAVSDNCCGPSVKAGIDDVAFIRQMISEISDMATIDSRRIYATGISNGGALAYRLVCNTDLFAAIGPDSTTLLGDCPSPHPTSVIHIHGLADQTFPYNGGPGKRNQAGESSTINTSGPAIPDLIASWQKIDSCGLPRTTVSGLVTQTEATCPGGRAVTLITIDGAGHQWPGAVQNEHADERLIKLDPPSTALDATNVIWDFFSQHPSI